MKFVKWIKDKYTKRHADKADRDPWWVTLMLDVGRPLVAVLILVMCAPGEHYLAMEAGWSRLLAWGMPGTLTAYAGIAAVVATKRKKGAPGRKTAITGAIISIMLAMAAQPIAHLYGRHGLTPQEVALTIAAGLIPAAVFGHLLHMGAAAPKPEKTAPVADEQPKADVLDKLMAEHGGHGIPVSEFLAERAVRPELGLSEYAAERGQTDRTPEWLADNRTEADRLGLSVDEIMSAPDTSPDMVTWTGHLDTDKDNHGQPDTRTEDLEIIATAATATRPRVSNVRSIKKGTLSADVRAYLSEHPDASDEDLAAAMSIKWPDAKWDSVRKARDRYQEKRTS